MLHTLRYIHREACTQCYTLRYTLRYTLGRRIPLRRLLSHLWERLITLRRLLLLFGRIRDNERIVLPLSPVSLLGRESSLFNSRFTVGLSTLCSGFKPVLSLFLIPGYYSRCTVGQWLFSFFLPVLHLLVRREKVALNHVYTCQN